MKKRDQWYWNLEARVKALEVYRTGYVTGNEVSMWSNSQLRRAYQSTRDQVRSQQKVIDKLKEEADLNTNSTWAAIVDLQNRLTKYEVGTKVVHGIKDVEGSLYHENDPIAIAIGVCEHCGEHIEQLTEQVSWRHIVTRNVFCEPRIKATPKSKDKRTEADCRWCDLPIYRYGNNPIWLHHKNNSSICPVVRYAQP